MRRRAGEIAFRIAHLCERLSVFFRQLGARCIYPKEFREALWRLEKKRLLRDPPFACPPDVPKRRRPF